MHFSPPHLHFFSSFINTNQTKPHLTFYFLSFLCFAQLNYTFHIIIHFKTYFWILHSCQDILNLPAMTIQEQETIELESPPPRVSSEEITSQLTGDDDSVPKTRKPYTITKQRERWTEEEHTKFLEALKLYGRAWRKIEEHVGTKTAIQIRSHAQKFFTKVVRESSTGDSSSEKPIEIPPPRPKRKPMHPYPRKQRVSMVTKDISIPEKIAFSSLDLSVSELENQSPTSVLSATGSETYSDEDLSGHNGSPSNGNTDVVTDSQTTNASAEFELSSNVEIVTPNDSPLHEKGSTLSFLKLFGKTLLVEDPQESCNMVNGSCESEPMEKSDKPCLSPPLVQFPETNFECTGELFQNGNVSANNSCYSPLSWLTLSVPTVQMHIPTLVKARPLYEQREGFSGESNNAECLFGNKEKAAEISFSSYKLNRRESFDCRKGFVPYKRCLSNRDSSEETVELPQKRRIHLCL